MTPTTEELDAIVALRTELTELRRRLRDFESCTCPRLLTSDCEIHPLPTVDDRPYLAGP